MEELLKYFIKETNSTLKSVQEDLGEVKKSVNDLQQFRASLIAQARLTSMIVSAACGLLTLLATLYFQR